MASFSSDVSAVKQGLSLAQNPDALYAAALNSLGANPVAMALLSPITKSLFDQVYNQVEGIASEEISTIGNAILSGASGALTSILGASGSAAASAALGAIGQAVGQVIGDIAPFAGMIAGNIVELAQMSSQFYAPSVAANQAITNMLLNRPVQGSGGGSGGFAVTPADIFAPNTSMTSAETFIDGAGKRQYIDQWSQHYYPTPFPYSTLGLCLAALTEGNDYHGPPYYPADIVALTGVTPSGGWSGGDSTIRHHNVAWAIMPHMYNMYLAMAGRADAMEPNVGMHYETRKTMQLLRLAMGSRASTKNGDPSVLMYSMWADLLTGAWTSGKITGGFSVFSLAHIWGPDGWNDAGIVGPGKIVPGANDNPFGFVDAESAFQGASSEAWTPIVNQVISLIGSWQKTQQAPVPPKPQMHLTFAPGTMAKICRTKLSRPTLTPPERAAAEAAAKKAGVSAAEIAHITANAARTALGTHLSPGMRTYWEGKAASAGMSSIQIAQASPLGWAPGLSPSLAPSVRGSIMLSSDRSRRLLASRAVMSATSKKLLTSPGMLSAFKKKS